MNKRETQEKERARKKGDRGIWSWEIREIKRKRKGKMGSRKRRKKRERKKGEKKI